MRFVDVLGGVMALALGVAALSVVVKPGSQFAQAATATGQALSGIISAAKA